MKLIDCLNKVLNEANDSFENKLFDAVDDKLEIVGAYCWEGGGSYKFDKREGDASNLFKGDLHYNVGASSTVEHDGDVAGIVNQVKNLRGKEVDVVIDSKNYSARIVTASVETRTEEQERDWDDEDNNGDGDQTCYAKGVVIIRFEVKK